MAEVFRIDPAGCGCTDCLVGHSVPVDRATDIQMAALLAGMLSDATYEGSVRWELDTDTDGLPVYAASLEYKNYAGAATVATWAFLKETLELFNPDWVKVNCKIHGIRYRPQEDY